jgi:hypothetical protein
LRNGIRLVRKQARNFVAAELRAPIRVVHDEGSLSLAVGATLTYFASRAPAHVGVLETIGGAMLIAGLPLAGSALRVIP